MGEFLLSVLVIGVLVFAFVTGFIAGKHRRGHRHSWTSWSRVWNEETTTLTEVQERTCTGCGMYEKNDPTPPEECPPHDWGEWVDVDLTYTSGERIVGQKRNCLDCNIREIRNNK